MTESTVADHYRAAPSRTLLEVALKLSQAVGGLTELDAATMFAADDDDGIVRDRPDRMSEAGRALLLPLERRMGETFKSSLSQLVEEELAIVRGILLDRLDAVDRMFDNVGMITAITTERDIARDMATRTDAAIQDTEARLARLQATLAEAEAVAAAASASAAAVRR